MERIYIYIFKEKIDNLLENNLNLLFSPQLGTRSAEFDRFHFSMYIPNLRKRANWLIQGLALHILVNNSCFICLPEYLKFYHKY